MRHLFPALQRFTYLNAAASSPLATPVAEAAMSHIRESVAEADLHFDRWLQLKERLRGRVAAFIGAASPKQVGFTASTSMGFHAVAELFWRRGIRRVVTLEAEFPSTTIPFLARGIELKVVKPRADGTYAVDDLEGGDAVAVSAVQYASGFVIDLRALVERCRATKRPLAVNVAQALGQVPIDVDGFDFMCGTSHKWMMAGYGTGLFYVREGWLEEHGLPWTGWFSPPDSVRWQNFPGSAWEQDVARGVLLRPEAAALEAGAGHWPSLFAFDAALSLVEGAGIANIHAHNLKLQAQLREGLARRGFVPNAPPMSGICVVKVQGNPNAAAHALLGEGLVVSARAGGLRFSTHVYNDASDIERALEIIDRVGARPA